MPTPRLQIDPELSHSGPNMSLAPILLDPEFAEQVTEDLASDAAEALRILRPPPRESSGIRTDDAGGIDLAAIGAAPSTGQTHKIRAQDPSEPRASTLRRPVDPAKGQKRVSRSDSRKRGAGNDGDDDDTKI